MHYCPLPFFTHLLLPLPPCKMFSSNSSPMTMDRRWKSNIETAPNCPRCASANTKFCYYNNYSLSQPRYFCKSCRRYWTKGGSLRNVPFGGASRKNRRGKPVRGPSDHVGSESNQPNSDSSSDGSCGDPFISGRTTGSDIDLAVVFSNFLNPAGSGSTLPEMESPDYDLDAIHFPPENENVVDFQGRLEIPITGMDYPGVHQPEFEQYMDPGMEMGLDAMQTLLGDEIDQDILWSETVDENSLPNFSWQEQQTELPEFEGVVDDHSMFHNNLLNGNWSSFDIPSYGA